MKNRNLHPSQLLQLLAANLINLFKIPIEDKVCKDGMSHDKLLQSIVLTVTSKKGSQVTLKDLAAPHAKSLQAGKLYFQQALCNGQLARTEELVFEGVVGGISPVDGERFEVTEGCDAGEEVVGGVFKAFLRP